MTTTITYNRGNLGLYEACPRAPHDGICPWELEECAKYEALLLLELADIDPDEDWRVEGADAEGVEPNYGEAVEAAKETAWQRYCHGD